MTLYNLHVLWHSSPSHRLPTRFSSSVLKRTFFERLRSPPGMSRFTLEHSTSDITESRHFIITILPLKKKTFSCESARLSQISPTLSNQQDSLEPARFSRTSKILSNQPDSPSRDSSHGTLQILAHGFLPSSHRPPQLPTA